MDYSLISDLDISFYTAKQLMVEAFEKEYCNCITVRNTISFSFEYINSPFSRVGGGPIFRTWTRLADYSSCHSFNNVWLRKSATSTKPNSNVPNKLNWIRTGGAGCDNNSFSTSK